MADVIHKVYCPFTREELRGHFLESGAGGRKSAEKHIEYYEKSAANYRSFTTTAREDRPTALSKVKLERQIEKDERFWTLAAMKSLFDDEDSAAMLGELLSRTFGEAPPFAAMKTWADCLGANPDLYFEACLPSPRAYSEWLRKNLDSRQFIPYVLDAVKPDDRVLLEGATHVDALLINRANGFNWLIEAKVLSDASYQISFDHSRNQIARNIDVMLEKEHDEADNLADRDPELSLFSLLTPLCFRNNPSTRLYGSLMRDYMEKPESLLRDLPHRQKMDCRALSKRIGWVTFEDIQAIKPEACSWPSEPE